MVDGAVARDDHVGDQLRPEQAVGDHARFGLQPRGERRGSSTGPVQSAITPPSGLERPGRRSGMLEAAQRRLRSVGEQLDRHRRDDALDDLLA